MADQHPNERVLALEAVRVVEAAALAAARFMGRGDEQAADQAAIAAMHECLLGVAMDGTVRIGVGTREETDRLFVGEKVGTGGGLGVDLALLPLEGPTIIAKGEPNGLSVVAMAEEGSFLDVPDLYMDKIAVGGGLPADIVDLDEEPAKNIGELAKAKGKDVSDIVVCTLNRPRHKELIAKTREAGARVMLIVDGDVSGIIATTKPECGVDIFLGIGGAFEGVLAAAALSCIGGQMQTRLVVRDGEEKRRLAGHGITDAKRKYDLSAMVSGGTTFAATGVTGGALLPGVRIRAGGAVTHSMVLRSSSGTLRYIETQHDFTREA